MRTLFFLSALVLTSSAVAGNFATCILDKMPSAQNDSAAAAIMQVCGQKYPGAYQNVPQGDGRGLFSYDSGAECAVKKASGTVNNRAGAFVRGACNCLYEESDYSNQTCYEKFAPRRSSDIFKDLIPVVPPQ